MRGDMATAETTATAIVHLHTRVDAIIRIIRHTYAHALTQHEDLNSAPVCCTVSVVVVVRCTFNGQSLIRALAFHAPIMHVALASQNRCRT